LKTVKIDKTFKKDIQRDKKSAKFGQDDFSELQAVMETLLDGRILDEKYLEHKFLGEHKDYLECHLKPN